MNDNKYLVEVNNKNYMRIDVGALHHTLVQREVSSRYLQQTKSQED